MAKVTSKLQVTVPRALADQYGIEPGDEIRWEAAGEVIRVVPDGKRTVPDRATRLRLFDKATARQGQRQAERPLRRATERGWTRDDLYERGRAR